MANNGDNAGDEQGEPQEILFRAGSVFEKAGKSAERVMAWLVHGRRGLCGRVQAVGESRAQPGEAADAFIAKVCGQETDS